MRQILIIILSTMLLKVAVAQQPQVIDKVVGVVGENPILLSEIELQFQQMLASGQATPDLRCFIFDNLLLEKLFLKQAQSDSIVVSQDEVDGELDRRIRYFISLFGTRDKLEEYYGKDITQIKDEFEEDIYKQLLAERMKASIFSGLKITPAEVKDFFNQIPEDSLPYFNAEVQLSQIVVYPQVGKGQKDYAYNKASKIREDIVNGADFCLKAILDSDDPGSKDDCGNLGYVIRGEMVPEFEAAAFRLDEGQVSEVVESEYGFHIIECLSKRGERVELRHILVAPKITRIEVEEAQTLVDSIENMLGRGDIQWLEAVREFSQDENSSKNEGLLLNQLTGTSTFDMEELEKDVAFALKDMEVGDISYPLAFNDELTGKQGIRLIRLNAETEPHAANLTQDYTKIQAAAKQAKQLEILESWVGEKSLQTYIFVDDLFRSCEGMDKWIKDN